MEKTLKETLERTEETSEEETFEITFDDLKEDVQQELLKFLGVTEDDINKELFVLGILYMPEED